MRSGLQLSVEHIVVLHQYLLERLGDADAAPEATTVFILDTAVAAAPPADALAAALPVLQRLAEDIAHADVAPGRATTIAMRLLELFTAPALEGLRAADRETAEACLLAAASLASGSDPGLDAARRQSASTIRAAALAAITADVFAMLGPDHRATAFRVRAEGRPCGVIPSPSHVDLDNRRPFSTFQTCA